MVLSGVTMGFVFDFYRVTSHRFRLPRWLLPALDVVFWAAATLGVFYILLDYNHGEVRLYVFLGLGIGITGYFGLFSARVVKAAGWLLHLVLVTSAGIWKMFRLLLIVPFMWVVRLLAKTLDIAFVITVALLLWTGRLLLVPLKPVGKYVWAKLLPVRKVARSWVRRLDRWKEKWKAVWDIFRKK